MRPKVPSARTEVPRTPVPPGYVDDGRGNDTYLRLGEAPGNEGVLALWTWITESRALLEREATAFWVGRRPGAFHVLPGPVGLLAEMDDLLGDLSRRTTPPWHVWDAMVGKKYRATLLDAEARERHTPPSVWRTTPAEESSAMRNANLHAVVTYVEKWLAGGDLEWFALAATLEALGSGETALDLDAVLANLRPHLSKLQKRRDVACTGPHETAIAVASILLGGSAWVDGELVKIVAPADKALKWDAIDAICRAQAKALRSSVAE